MRIQSNLTFFMISKHVLAPVLGHGYQHLTLQLGPKYETLFYLKHIYSNFAFWSRDTTNRFSLPPRPGDDDGTSIAALADTVETALQEFNIDARYFTISSQPIKKI